MFRYSCNGGVCLAEPNDRVQFSAFKAGFDPASHGNNPLLEATFLAGMKPTRRGRSKLDAAKVEVKIRLDAKIVEYLRSLPNLRCNVD